MLGIGTMTLGLYGGSFDPVHLGHLLVARAAIEEVGLDRLVFIPAAQSPFKPGVEPAPGAARLRLLRLALAGEVKCEVDDQEVRRGGVSYTIETVRTWRARCPGARLLWLIGADHVEGLPRWRDAEVLASMVEFLVIPRPGAALPSMGGRFRLRSLRGWPLAVSASEIRTRVRAGLPVGHLVPAEVAEAIRSEGWYQAR